MGILIIRLATADDLSPVHAIVTEHAQAGNVLPRSRRSLEDILEWLVVAVDDGVVVGAVALHPIEKKTGEVRSLSVATSHQGLGIGPQLVTATLDLAKERDFDRVICFTRHVGFFSRLNFTIVHRDTIPVKYFLDCVHCPKLAHCDETAMEFAIRS